MSKPRPSLPPSPPETRKIGDLLGVSFKTPPAIGPTQSPPASPSSLARKTRQPPLELWISKAGRAGKAVTLIKGSASSPEKEALLGTLKRRLGVGGALKDGEILIQSTDRPRISEILQDAGWATKICGG